MNLDKPISPRHFEVSHDIGSPRQQVLPQVTHAEPGRAESPLVRLERRLDLVESILRDLIDEGRKT